MLSQGRLGRILLLVVASAALVAFHAPVGVPRAQPRVLAGDLLLIDHWLLKMILSLKDHISLLIRRFLLQVLQWYWL